MKKFLDDVKNIVTLLIHVEELIGYLYEKFSIQFSENKIWLQLSNDEARHVNILNKVFQATDYDKVSIDLRVMTEKELKATVKLIEGYIKNSKKYSLAQALTLAYKLECTIAEEGYFKIFYSRDKEFKKVFAYLEKEVARHAHNIFLELKKIN